MLNERQHETVTRKKSKGRVLKAGPRITNRESCCESQEEHPDHSHALPRIRRIQGQISGVEKMIRERRYCPEILIQTRAIYSAMRALEATILEAHVRGCVREAMLFKSDKNVNEKISELVGLFMSKS